MLKTVLRLNALSCFVFGVLFLAQGGPVAAFLGAAPAWVVQVLGAVLVANAATMAVASARGAPLPCAVRTFALGDFAWVAGTLALVGAGVFVTSPAGTAAALAVAVMVGVFGALQWRLAGL